MSLDEKLAYYEADKPVPAAMESDFKAAHVAYVERKNLLHDRHGGPIDPDAMRPPD